MVRMWFLPIFAVCLWVVPAAAGDLGDIALADAARAQASAGNIQEALITAQAIEDASIRDMALADIASARTWGPDVWEPQGEKSWQKVTDEMLSADPAESWLHTNGNWAGHRYSLLKQLDTSNASNLKVAWMYSTGGKTEGQSTPLYHDGLLYFAEDNRVFALDVRTGRRVWKFEHELPEDWGYWQFNDFLTNKHHSVAIYQDKVYFLSNDNVLYALHYKTGEQLFNRKIREHPLTHESSEDAGGYLSTAGPLVIPGKVLLPMNPSDMSGKPGYVDAVDAETGDLLWSANMIPGPGEPGYESWPGNSQDYGGAGPWITGIWDSELKMYYTGTANAYPYTLHSEPQGRGGDDYEGVGGTAVVAVDTDTGKVAWRYTVLPGDRYDYDTMQVPLALTIDGRKTVVQPNKTGFISYLDAQTGEFLKATPFLDHITWASGFTDDGKLIWTQTIPREGGDPVEVWPSLPGGVNVYPPAYNPQTGMIYLSAREMSTLWGIEGVQVTNDAQFAGATFDLPSGGYELNKAVDAVSGQETWRDQKSKDGYSGGMLTTAGNLVFYTSQTGVFHAADATTGEILYTFNLNTKPKSGPITYMLDGKQYVVQAIGGLQQGQMVVAFSRF